MTKLVAITEENSTSLTLRPSRPSIWEVIAGLLFFGPGALFLYVELHIALATKVEPHLWHILAAFLMCMIGAVIPFGRYVIPKLTSLSVVIAPYVPRLGGSRPGDPQPDGTVNPPAPPPAPFPPPDFKP